MNELFVIAWMLFGIYMLVLLLIGADYGVDTEKLNKEVKQERVICLEKPLIKSHGTITHYWL